MNEYQEAQRKLTSLTHQLLTKEYALMTETADTVGNAGCTELAEIMNKYAGTTAYYRRKVEILLRRYDD